MKNFTNTLQTKYLSCPGTSNNTVKMILNNMRKWKSYQPNEEMTCCNILKETAKTGEVRLGLARPEPEPEPDIFNGKDIECDVKNGWKWSDQVQAEPEVEPEAEPESEPEPETEPESEPEPEPTSSSSNPQ
jgi:hypothetical protein